MPNGTSYSYPTFDMAGDAEQFSTAGIRNTFVGKRLTAVADDKRHGSEGFGIVDGGRLAVQAERGGNGAVSARLAFLPSNDSSNAVSSPQISAVAGGRRVHIQNPEPKIFLPKSLRHVPAPSGFKALVASKISPWI